MGQGLVHVTKDGFVERPLTASRFVGRAGLGGCNGGLREEVESGANTTTLSGGEHDFISSLVNGRTSAEQAHDQSQGEDEEDKPESDRSAIHVVPLVRHPLPLGYPKHREAEAEYGEENEAEDEEQYKSDVEAEADEYEDEGEEVDFYGYVDEYNAE